MSKFDIIGLVRTVLNVPLFYSTFRKLVSSNRGALIYVQDYIQPKSNDKILDIGCGPGDILKVLPQDIDYTGFDLSPSYIESAQKRFGHRGRFFCKRVSTDAVSESEQFDIVLATGVLHHLNDDEALMLFELARSVLKPTGKLVTADGCFLPTDQSFIERFLLHIDRGKFVRDESGYTHLAKQVFPNVAASIRHDLPAIPYTHLIMECRL